MRKSTNKFEIVGDILKITTASGTLILADEEAKKARREAEKKYFGEFAPSEVD